VTGYFTSALPDTRVVLVTGAAGGVGSAVSRRFRDGGWTVFGVDVAPGVDFTADLTVVDNCRAAVDGALSAHGRLDGVVLAAGVWTEGPTAESTEAEYDRTFDVNVKSTYFTLSAALPHLANTAGHATVISSDAGVQGNAGAAIYSASKGAVTNLVRAVAREVAPSRVRVNAVCPGDIDSPMLQGQASVFGGADPDAYLAGLLAAYPQGDAARFIRTDEVAELCWFLAQDHAAAITGANLSIDFGLSAGI
jgi:NAD(P)-dependent dehydrogenase (short-subunit alcohol dehydrogenase family)